MVAARFLLLLLAWGAVAALGGCARETALDFAARVAQAAVDSRCARDEYCVNDRELERYRLHRAAPDR